MNPRSVKLLKRCGGEPSQCLIFHQPWSERQPEAMFFLANGFERKKIAKSSLEKVPQRKATDLH